MYSISPPTGKIFNAHITSDDWYLWDNYGYIEDRVTHIYAQAADKNNCEKAEDRYWKAYWRHFISYDDGRTWIDEGPAIHCRKGEAVYDSLNIWSGSVLPRDDGIKMAAYTGLEEGKLALQSIAIAISNDGYLFQRVNNDRPLLSAFLDYEQFISKGYYFGPKETIGNIDREEDGTFLCLRDPFLFPDKNGKIHIFYGAKAWKDGTIVRAVGHAIFKDPKQIHEVEILPPIFVPDGETFNQLELPNVFQRDGKYYLVISTTNLAYIGQPDIEAQKTVRIYFSEFLDRNWKPYGDNGQHIIITPETRLYGLNVLNTCDKQDNPIICRAFIVGESSIPPSIIIKVEGNTPVLIFPEDLWGNTLMSEVHDHC
jgi:hypothetical protein